MWGHLLRPHKDRYLTVRK